VLGDHLDPYRGDLQLMEPSWLRYAQLGDVAKPRPYGLVEICAKQATSDGFPVMAIVTW
jgi:hypothetical protein